MFRKKITITVIILVFLVVSVTFLTAFSKKGKVKEIDQALLKGQEEFALEIFKQIDETGNFMISPLSISLALGMCLNGSAGMTLAEITDVLNLDSEDLNEIDEFYLALTDKIVNIDPEVQIKIANSIWYKKEIQLVKNYSGDMNKYFSAKIMPSDFGYPGTVDLINQWVRDNTENKIEKIIEYIPPLMNAYLINAVYFKGSWTEEFDAKRTRKSKFLTGDKKEIQCDMMSKDGDFEYLETSLLQAINLPYGEGKLMMTIMLPREGFNLDQLSRDLNGENWQEWKNSFAVSDGHLQMPKFKMEYSIDLVQTLRSIGMIAAFDSQAADFSRMSEDASLYVDEVKHKTYIDVNEEGTEAAAVTSIGMKTVSIPPPGFVMIVNHPFIFMIRNEDTIIFSGKVVEPAY